MTQDVAHAFTAAPLVLMLQLGRFRAADGRIIKLHTSIEVDDTIQVPIFTGDDVQIRHAAYHCTAMICLHGAHPKTGRLETWP